LAELLFFIAAFGAIAGAVAVVTLENPFYSVLALVTHLLSLAALFLLLRAEFVAAAQVVVYAGAVMVLYVFVVAYIGEAEAVRSPASPGLRGVSVVFVGALLVELFIAVLGTGLAGVDTEGAPFREGFGSPQEIGRLLLTDFLLAFEVASVLLLIAAVGAVVLARRRRGLHPEDDQHRFSARDMLRPAGTGTMAEAASGLPDAGGEPPGSHPKGTTEIGAASGDRQEGGW
jgi:NADH:ubiquinone oxidoreductase subunit 6 (subunit J)